jgi:hypothetical protein
MSDDGTPYPDGIVSRRGTLLTAGALLAGGGSAAALLSTSADKASAELTRSEFDVSDGSYTSPTGDIYSPVVEIDGSFRFQVGTEAAAYEIRLLAAPDAESWEVVASLRAPVATAELSDTFALSGALVEHSAWDADTWDAPLDSTTETQVYLRLELAVLDSAGTALAESSVATSAIVAVTNSTVESVAFVDGDGSITVQATPPNSTA